MARAPRAAAAAPNETTQAQAAAASTANVPAVQAGSNALPAFLNEVEMSGKGVSNKQADKLIPMARVLQPLSPQVLQNNPDQIQGALAGDILIRNAPKPLIKGAVGFLFQSCFFYKDVVQWKPRNTGGGGGQGFVKRYNVEEIKDAATGEILIEGAEERPDPRDATKKIWVHAPTGDWLVETRYHVGYVIDPEMGPMPCYIPFSSTGHSVSKGWVFSMSLKTANGKPADSFAVYYLLKTRQRTRGNNTWFVFDPQDAGPADQNGQPTTHWVPTLADYQRGLELSRALEAGEIGLADEETTDSEAGQANRAASNDGAF